MSLDAITVESFEQALYSWLVRHRVDRLYGMLRDTGMTRHEAFSFCRRWKNNG